jgi:hypothetical protein
VQAVVEMRKRKEAKKKKKLRRTMKRKRKREAEKKMMKKIMRQMWKEVQNFSDWEQKKYSELVLGGPAGVTFSTANWDRRHCIRFEIQLRLASAAGQVH